MYISNKPTELKSGAIWLERSKTYVNIICKCCVTVLYEYGAVSISYRRDDVTQNVFRYRVVIKKEYNAYGIFEFQTFHRSLETCRIQYLYWPRNRFHYCFTGLNQMAQLCAN